VVQFAIGETVLSSTIEGRLRFPIRVRYAPEFRADPRAIGDTLVTAPGGARVPLRAVADVRPTRGPAMISSENGLLVASVLMNVQDRDVGGFVDEARAAVAARVAVPPGYYVGWSGRYENQARARGRLQLVLPIVVAVIFLLLYVTYRSAIEAAHVLLAVPFALTGGVYLLWALDYNFSVAVWVGFIALFGTAVQTAVVMVIYLEDAVARRRAADGGVLTRAALREAVREGALLRLRPKVMTVATVVASLLPIMWSTRVGADVMKPLATPVLGGMVSSLLHVLLVMPVIFFWVHARRLPSEPAAVEAIRERPPAGRRRLVVAAAIVALAVAAALAALAWREWKSRRATPAAEADLALVARAGDVEIRVLAPGAALAQGARDFELVFRTLPAGAPFDAGDVSVAASMPMPGMTMTGGVTVEPTGKRGRYRARGQFDMAGAWQFVVRWNGPVGSGSASFEGAVR
jgi:Cu(I)/Ag(I) efflux system membrane protein CusA/SilA